MIYDCWISWRIVPTSRSYLEKSIITSNNPQNFDVVVVGVLPCCLSLVMLLKSSLRCIMREILSCDDCSHSSTVWLTLSPWRKKCHHNVGVHTHTVDRLKIMSEDEGKQSDLGSQSFIFWNVKRKAECKRMKKRTLCFLSVTSLLLDINLWNKLVTQHRNHADESKDMIFHLICLYDFSFHVFIFICFFFTWFVYFHVIFHFICLFSYDFPPNLFIFMQFFTQFINFHMIFHFICWFLCNFSLHLFIFLWFFTSFVYFHMISNLICLCSYDFSPVLFILMWFFT